MAYIYKITNLVNKKIYIGKTTFSIDNRWKKHLEAARRGIDYPLYKAIRKYGEENFVISEIEEVSLNDINEREKFWIKELQSFIIYGKGYNATLGGEGDSTIDREEVYNLWDQGFSIKQIVDQIGHDRGSIRNILKNYSNYSTEESNIRGDKIQGKDRWQEVEQYDVNGNLINHYCNMQEAEKQTGVSSKNIWNAIHQKVQTAGGFQWTFADNKNKPKALEKIRKYKQKVLQYDLSLKLVQEYDSAAEAKRKTGISDICIRNCCKGKQKTAGGYIWKYKE